MDRIPLGRFSISGDLALLVEDRDGVRVFSLVRGDNVISQHLAGYSPESDRAALAQLLIERLGLSA